MKVAASLLEQLKTPAVLLWLLILQTAVNGGESWELQNTEELANVKQKFGFPCLSFCEMPQLTKRPCGSLRGPVERGVLNKAHQLPRPTSAVCCPAAFPALLMMLQSVQTAGQGVSVFVLEYRGVAPLGLVGYLLWSNLKGRAMLCLLTVVFLPEEFLVGFENT